MKLKTMEKALDIYPNRFQLTMMAVARAKEINEGDKPLVELDGLVKPVVVALEETARGFVVPAELEEMKKIRSARKVLLEKALREAREKDALMEQEENSEIGSAQSEALGES